MSVEKMKSEIIQPEKKEVIQPKKMGLLVENPVYKPSLVVVTESPTSNERMKKIFNFIDLLLKKTGKIGEYDQKI